MLERPTLRAGQTQHRAFLAADDEHAKLAPDATRTHLLADFLALRLVLFGQSAMDLTRLWFAEQESVDAFLRLCQFDTDNPLDLSRLAQLHHEAISYLAEVHRYRLPLPIEQPRDIDAVFLAAASQDRSREQRFACMTLKVMHILHHISCRELLFNTPISEAQLFDRLGTKVFATIDRMRACGVSVVEFAAGQKSRESLATKLLAKRNNLATHIFDKLRFRIVVETRRDLVLALRYFVHELFPFNYVLPEQSQNDILTQEDIAEAMGLSAKEFQQMTGPHRDVASIHPSSTNEFSAHTYKTINFVADIPLRIDDIAPQTTPAIAFAQTEIQLVDAATAHANEHGPAAHALYKKRQRARVRSRLEGNDVETR